MFTIIGGGTGKTQVSEPDIVNGTTRFLWEVKAGGDKNDPGSADTPAPSTVSDGATDAQRQVDVLNTSPYYTHGWKVGDISNPDESQNDLPLQIALKLCGGKCTLDFADASQLKIWVAAKGVIAYSVSTKPQASADATLLYVQSADGRTSWTAEGFWEQVEKIILAGPDAVQAFLEAIAKGATVAEALALIAKAMDAVVTPAASGGEVVTGLRDIPEWAWAASRCSFSRDTEVETPYGLKEIGYLREGDLVLTFNTLTHKIEIQPVFHVWVHPDEDLVNLIVAYRSSDGTEWQESLHTTSKHPFLIQGTGFVPAGQLVSGMRVLSADGALGTVLSLQSVPGTEIMYNLEIITNHTFMVGDGQWIVHNGCTVE